MWGGGTEKERGDNPRKKENKEKGEMRKRKDKKYKGTDNHVKWGRDGNEENMQGKG